MGNSCNCAVLCCGDRGIEMTHSYPVKPNVCHTMYAGALYHDDLHPGLEIHVGTGEKKGRASKTVL